MAPGDLGDQAQMTVDELVRRLVVAVLAPALRQNILFVRFQHRDPPGLLNIAGEGGFGRHSLIRGGQPSQCRSKSITQLSNRPLISPLGTANRLCAA